MLAFMAYPDESRYWPDFLIPALSMTVLGALLWSIFPHRQRRFSVVDGAVVVVVTWTIVCIVSAFSVQRIAHLTFTQSVFEAVSGWTTTGLSVINVETAPKTLLLWRSIMQLGGGAGLAIIMLAAFSLPIGAGLYRAEGRADQLVPNVIRSTKLVVLLYAVYAGAGIVAYILAGMTPFDAINHSFSAVSTGGFSTKADSIGFWNSAAIEAVTIPLMILGNMNFLTAYVLFRGKIGAFLRNAEMKVLGVAILVGVVLVFLLVTNGLYPLLSKSGRVAIFDTISAITTTGYSTVSYTDWPAAGILVFIVLMLIGGGTCSTAGGIKQFRVYLLFKSVFWDIKRLLLPKNAVIENSFWQGEERVFVRKNMIREVGTFVFLYMSLYFIGAFVMTAFGYSLQESLFEFASTLGTVGLSIGLTSSTTPAPVLWVQTFGMLLGRLEIIVIILFFGQIAKRSGIILRQRIG